MYVAQLGTLEMEIWGDFASRPTMKTKKKIAKSRLCWWKLAIDTMAMGLFYIKTSETIILYNIMEVNTYLCWF
jgi:hypothetical protein